MEKRFDEGFDNILIYHYDEAYRKGKRLDADTMVIKEGRTGLSMNGKWKFSPDVFSSVIRTRWFDETRYNRNGQPIPYDFDFDAWDEITVPGVWNNQKPEYALYEGPGLYFRTFSREELRKQGFMQTEGSRLFLRIGAANYETRIWLNKQYLGRHLGGFTPFCADLTDALEDENRLLIFVDNTRRGGQIPSVHYDWFNYGGIFREAELFETPDMYIQDAFIQLSGGQKGQMEYQIKIKKAGDKNDSTGAIPAEINIPELGIFQKVDCCENTDSEPGLYQADGTFEVNEEEIQKWSPQTPVLYKVSVHIAAEGGDAVEDLIGFRRIETKGRHIFLNGEEVFLKGMCVHEESSRSMRSLTKQEIEAMLKQVKELGCNFLRLTHYPHSEWTAKLADKLGIMLLEEIPVYWALEFENPDTYQDASNQLRELICRDRSRASVIIWSVGNENPDSDDRYRFMEGLVRTARSLDSGRLIAASCLIDVEQKKIKDRLIQVLDIVGINEYYGWYLKDFEVLEEILGNYKEDKPVIITETGADAVCGYFSETAEIYSEELQAEIYEKQFQTLLKYSFIRGITPWILYDYASMRRMSSLQKGYNLKGIIGKDRIYKKKAYEVVKSVYEKIQ